MRTLSKIIIILLVFISTIGYGKPIKVLSLTLSGDEILLGLGAKNQMVGVCGDIVDNPKYSNIVGKLDNMIKVENNLEEIMILNPDLVIVADWMDRDRVQHLKNAGINLLEYKTPRSFNDLKAIIKLFNLKLGVKTKSEQMIKDIDKRIDNIKKYSTNIKYKKRVLLYSRYGTTSGKNTIFDDMSYISNFENVAKTYGIIGNQKISKEKIIEFNPDIIIIPSYSITDNEPFVDTLLSDKGLESVEAIKNKRVYTVKGRYMMTSSQYMIDGLEKVFKLVYPKL